MAGFEVSTEAEATMFASVEDWLERGMKPDHDDFAT
jgi:hypothetical protein